MEWQSLLWIGGIALLFWFMMRGCGGMGGGCGMGSRRSPTADGSEAGKAPDRQKRDNAA